MTTTPLPQASTRERALVPVLFFLGIVVAIVSALGAPLVPLIAETVDVDLAEAQWSLTIAVLVAAVATPSLGRLSDGPRRRTVVLATVAAVVVGNVLAALPLGFEVLLIGRGLQGLGLGLVPLAMAVARDALPKERAATAIALLSVTVLGGTGLGYALTGLIADVAGLRGAFWFGAAISAVGLLLAALVLPPAPARPRRPFDLLGAVLLGAALAGLVLALAEAEVWGWGSARQLAVAVSSLLLLGWWMVHELRTEHPLVDLRLARSRPVRTAGVAAVLTGVGNYLLLSMVVRFVQTPTTAGYGFGSSVLVAGLVLVPFSATSLVASRFVPLISRRWSADAVLPIGCLVYLAAMASFAVVRQELWQVVTTMAIAGLGVGLAFAAMPGMIARAVPASETGSAMSFNQVLRMSGFSVGSALSATLLQAYTPAGQVLPQDQGYQVGALVGCGIWVLATVLAVLLPRRQ